VGLWVAGLGGGGWGEGGDVEVVEGWCADHFCGRCGSGGVL
jgi:hypothetical protein